MCKAQTCTQIYNIRKLITAHTKLQFIVIIVLTEFYLGYMLQRKSILLRHLINFLKQIRQILKTQ